jgi:hypothetical protein
MLRYNPSIMSVALSSPPTREEFLEVKTRLQAVEAELEKLRNGQTDAEPKWRASMRRMQEGWASMPTDMQAEFSAVLDQAIADARAVRVDDE